MISRWTSHLKTQEEKDKFIKNVLGSRTTFNRLNDILDEMEKGEDIVASDYDNPNWAYRQADINGFKRCLSILKKLTDLDQQDKK